MNFMNQSEHAVRIDNLSYFYRSHWTFKRFKGLQPFSLEIAPGESFGFLGHNGAGKTTTIKCILNLLTPASGRVELFGVDARRLAARKQVGYLPELPYFYEHLTVGELLELYAALAEVPRPGRRERVAEALEQVQLSSERKSPLRTLSKGQTQRVAMAQALVGRPRLLVLDEPFSGLDPLGRKEFTDLLLSLKKSGTTIFMSSHILSDVEYLCDRVSIMAQGRLLGVFSLHEKHDLSRGRFELVLRNMEGLADWLAITAERREVQERFIRYTFSSRSAAQEALQAALAAGAQVESYQFDHERLEELFVRLIKEAEQSGSGGED